MPLLGKKKPPLGQKARLHTVQTLKAPFIVLFRMFVIGIVAVLASIWAIWRHHTVPHVPMFVPLTSASASSPAPPATEIPVDLEPAP